MSAPNKALRSGNRMAHIESDRHVLIVEGNDDERVIHHFVDRIDAVVEFSILSKGGIDPLLAAIERDIKVSGRDTVGIVADANDDLNARWQAVTDRIRRAGLGIDPSAHPDPAGTIIREAARRPRVGIWLMPDNQSSGELEDFVAGMIPRDDPVWPKAETYINETIRDIPMPPRKFTEKKAQRAKVHAWLAAREDPRRMGAAIRARDLDVDVQPCRAFAEWLRQLFTPSHAP